MKKLYFILTAFMAATSFGYAQEDKSEPAKNDSEELFIDYEENAQFPGGEQECFKFLAANVRYPAECQEQGIQGRVLVSFVVNTDGSIEEIKAKRSPDPALSKEAERVVGLMPKWKPAMYDGKAVRSRFYLPIMFRLKTDEPQKPDSVKADMAANDIPQAVPADNDDERVYEFVETNAQFPGGQQECYKWLAQNMKYPVKAQEEGIQGRVIVSFVVNRDGSIVDVKTLRSPHSSLTKEAERLVKSMPKWKPATQGGKTVRSRFNLPLMFSLH